VFTIRSARLAGLLLLSLPLVACESDAVLPPDDTPGTTGELQVDATSNSAFAYIDLDQLTTVSVSDPTSSTAWDLGIRRYEVRLSGGVAGPGGVDAALLIDHSAQPTATILGYTPTDRLNEFEAITAADIPSASAFSTTALVNDPSGWFAPAGQTLVANPGRVWKMRLADGGYAVLRVAELTLDDQGLTQFRVEYRLQPDGGSLGALQSVSVTPGAPGSPTRISLASGSATEATDCGWDLAVDAALTVSVNGTSGCHAGTFPLEIGETFDGLTTAADAPDYGPFLAALSSPIANSIDAADSPPFLYGIDETNPHRLVPTFNVYLVRRGNNVFKVQFLSYYDPAGGASGVVTLRVARLR
jgi:hypothetical protein